MQTVNGLVALQAGPKQSHLPILADAWGIHKTPTLPVLPTNLIEAKQKWSCVSVQFRCKVCSSQRKTEEV